MISPRVAKSIKEAAQEPEKPQPKKTTRKPAFPAADKPEPTPDTVTDTSV